MNKARLLGVFAVGCAGAVFAVACGSSDSAAIPAPDAGVDSATSIITPTTDAGAPETSTGSPDGSTDDDDDSDASTLDDGGSNIDPDAGDDDDDAGDAGPCNTVTNDATSILSVCSSQIPGLTGGALVAGTYHLVEVDALGSADFCKNTFIPIRVAETLVLTVDGTGVGTAQLSTSIANAAKSKATTLMLAPPAGNGSPLEQTQTCPPKAEEKTIYESALRAQKQVLVIDESYGAGRGLYRYEKQ